MIPDIKYLLIMLCCFCVLNKTKAQAGNVYLDGDNYITLSNPAFPERMDWSGFTEIHPLIGQEPIVTNWFVHNGKSHIAIHLQNGKGTIFMELSFNKKVYQFPKNINYTPADNPGQYRFNDLWLFVAEKSGIVRKFVGTKNSHLTIRVDQLDPSHLKLNFEGTIAYYPHPSKWDSGPASDPMNISGKISLSKKNPSLEHLPDNYAGCDNTIYNEVSPNWKLGAWYNATACEESFYKKIFTALSHALKPVSAYFKTRGWIVSESPYKPLDVRRKEDVNNIFTFSQFTTDRNFIFTADAPYNSGENADFNERYLKFIQTASLTKNGHLDTATAIKSNEFSNEAKEFSLKMRILINSSLETESSYPKDLNELPVKKINDSVYLIKKVISHDFRSTTFYNTYLLIGKWNAPAWKDRSISTVPQFSLNAKKLSVQAYYIELDCEEKLANAIIRHLNIGELEKVLAITP